jgi:hypothetical protein
VDEEIITKTPFTPKSYDAAMKEHDTEGNLLAREDAELEGSEELSDDEAAKEDVSAARLGEELKRLAASEASLNSTNAQLTQHVNVQGKCFQAKEREINELGDKCDVMVAFAKWLSAEVRAEALLTFESAGLLRQIMDTHRTKHERYREKNRIAREEALALNGGDPRDSESEGESVDEANRTPSPAEQGAEHSLKIGAELPIDESVEQDQEHQPLQTSLLEEGKPPASANPAKRNLSSSDDSDVGNGKPDMQRMKGEHGAVTRTRTTRSNRWGATHEQSGKEESQSSSTAVAFGMAKELAADRQLATPRRGVSNNLRAWHS